MKNIIGLVLGIFLISGVLFAEDPPKENQVVLKVSGVVCSFCAYGLKKKLSKLKFVDKKFYDKGVLIDIKNGLVTLAIKPEAQISPEKIEKRVKKAGYELLEIVP